MDTGGALYLILVIVSFTGFGAVLFYASEAEARAEREQAEKPGQPH